MLVFWKKIFGKKGKFFEIFPFSLVQLSISFFIFSSLFGSSFASSKLIVNQKEKEDFLIKETGLFPEQHDTIFAKTAYAYYELLSVDGNCIIESDIKTDGENEEFYFVVDNANLLNINSPAGFLLPSIQRHGTIVYKVKEGDTPGKIAAQFGINLNTVLWANGLKNNSIIKPDQELIILPVSGVRHIVKKGETLASLAKKYSASIEEIIAFNNLNSPENISENQELIIPGGKISSSSGSSSSLAAGLKPMAEDVSSWPNLSTFSYPTSGGYNKGVLHYYNAIDIINSCGSPIYAADSGIITEAKGNGSYNYGYGNLIKIQHYNGTVTVYGHLSDVLVKEGNKVEKGGLIGRMGDTGNSNGCHLHFEVRGAQNPFVIKK
ncbi:MAG: LysM peptidoglycan-binding domain-containing M23 family metallopeptidase [Candidatus Pacebacteria bacterium]|nr:LysM peptidoglycan-binding domain-containing M23 family metallopeptidase [Candidatus Paceibacterota bacterium]